MESSDGRRPDYRIRKATTADAGQLFALNEAYNGAGSSSVDRMTACLDNLTAETVFVAESAGSIVGFACVQRHRSPCYGVDYAEVTELYVPEGSRRRGIARALLAALEMDCRKEGIVHFQLFTGADNVAAQTLYESSGFRRTSEVLYRKRP